MKRSVSSQRVVVLGGSGAMGRIIVQDLLRTAQGAIEPVVADREIEPARSLGVRAIRTDVTDPESLRRALRGASAVIASLPYRFNLLAMDAALEARATYVDLGGLFHMTRRQLRRRREFRDAGVTALLGMGSAPGILNVLAAHAADGLDRVDEVHCMVGASDRTRFREAPILGFGYSPETLLDEFARPSAVFRRGQTLMVPPLDPGERVTERFPSPVGSLALDTTLHSEVATLPGYFASRGVREVTFRQGFDRAFLDRLAFLVRLGLADDKPLPRLDVVPRDVLLALIERLPVPQPEGPPERYEILRVRVLGRQGRKKVSVTADCHAGPSAGWGVGPDIDTGAPPSIAVKLLLSGEMKSRPGVFAPEEIVPAEPFIRELQARGMRVRMTSRAV